MASERKGAPWRLPPLMSRLLRHRLLSPPEVDRLVRRAQAGDQAAKDELIRANCRLVFKIAKRHRHLPDLELEDLFQVGIIGLAKAIDRYDPDHPSRASLSSYAAWWIRAYILRSIIETGRLIRLPVWLHEEIARFDPDQPIEDDPRQQLIQRAIQLLTWHSLFEPARPDRGKLTFLSFLPLPGPSTQEQAARLEIAGLIDRALARLKPVHAEVLRCRYEQDLTLTETARHLYERGLAKRVASRQNIEQVEKRAKEQFRRALAGLGLKNNPWG